MKCIYAILIGFSGICIYDTSTSVPYDEEKKIVQRNNENSNCTVEIKNDNVVVSTENSVLNINWAKSPIPSECNITFQLELFDGEEQVYAINTSYTSVDIDFPLIGCKVYQLSLSTITNNIKTSSVSLPIALVKDPSPPICIVTETGSNFADLECALNNNQTLCDLFEIIINCESETTTDIAQVIKKIPDNAKAIKYNIGNLAPYTNYSCTATTKMSDGSLSENSSLIQIQTKEDVPSSPFLASITSKTNTSFVVEWTAPKVIPGVLRGYRITVSPKNACYYVPPNCSFIENNTPHNYTVNDTINKYTVKDVLSCYNYEVYVQAKTIDYGPPSEVNQVLTSGGTPSGPDNVDFLIINHNGNKFDVSVEIRWEYPCPANGVVSYFHVQLIGYPLIDTVTEQNYTVNVEAANVTSIYQTTIHNLEPAYNYTIILKSVSTDTLESKEVLLNFDTPEYVPEAPMIRSVTNVTEKAFTIEWNEPHRKNGNLTMYYLYIHNNGPNHLISTDCVKNMGYYNYSILPTNLHYRFEKGIPDYNYTLTIQAATKVNVSSLSGTFDVTTKDSEPEEAQNIKIIFINKQQEYYNVHANISFQIPCNTNGEFRNTTVLLVGNRPNKANHKVQESINTLLPEYNFLISVQAEYNYKAIVQVITKKFIKSSVQYVVSPSGVPPLGRYVLQRPIQITETRAKVNISQNLFNDTSGDIIYYSVIIGEFPYQEEPRYGFWNGKNETWPEISINVNEEVMQSCELTPRFWNPFLNSGQSVYTFVIGDDEYDILQPAILYSLKVRGFTKEGYRDTPIVTFQLAEDYDASGFIFGSLFGILGTVMLLGSVLILWRKRKKWAMEKESVKSIQMSPIPISVKSFPHYYSELSNNAEKLKQEYMLLTSKSGEITSSNSIGLLVQNKKKNRYTNIIPYDHSRVILSDTDELTTDYINASYIKGFTGDIEYIATQGPLEHTVVDFWKMVLQENVTLIVMVAQFVEQNKNKCYKYFPNNHENMELENGLTLRCCTELNFNTYIVRTITIQDDMEQRTITHLQFTDWPDFGCPSGTEIMLEFCQLMREYAEKNKAPIILHCSAGVGRTGTLIALDTILQAINHNKDIDIFNTVLNLRRDRKNMVQTEKQYLFIHSCINDSIEKPLPIKNYQKDVEPIYENVKDIKEGLSTKESQL